MSDLSCWKAFLGPRVALADFLGNFRGGGAIWSLLNFAGPLPPHKLSPTPAGGLLKGAATRPTLQLPRPSQGGDACPPADLARFAAKVAAAEPAEPVREYF